MDLQECLYSNYCTRHSHLLGIHKIREYYIVKNMFELFINTLKEIGGMDNLIIAKSWYVVENMEHQ